MTSRVRSLPRRHEPDLADLAAFTVDAAGVVTSWPEAAARLFVLPAAAVIGADLCDILLTSPGQRNLVRHALAEAAAGRVWSATVAGGQLGEGRFAIRCEPLSGPSGTGVDGAVPARGGVMVVIRRAWPQPKPSWLATAASRIGGTLDLGLTAAEVAAVAVPAFADAAVIYVVEHLLAADDTARPRPGPGLAVRRLVGRLSDQIPNAADRLMPAGEVIVMDPGTPGFQAMATGQPVIFEQLDSQSAERMGRRRGGSETVARFISFLAMPLIARGTVVGCVMFGRTADSPPFSPGELPHAGELASRAAVCLDNARLYHRERRTALALQHGLLPGPPDTPPGMQIAHSYVPVGSNIVGGDWHDVIALPQGRTAIVVGDAMGHGPEAAAAMAQLRAAARILVGLDLPPRQLLHRLDRLVGAVTTAPFATCVCAIIDPGGSTGTSQACVASRAGHPPPVLVAADGACRVLDLPAGLPLGLGETSFEETTTALPPGVTLAFYTDGLVESRGRPIDDGMAELCRALESALAVPDADLEAVCEAVTRKMARPGEDDITLLLARIRQ